MRKTKVNAVPGLNNLLRKGLLLIPSDSKESNFIGFMERSIYRRICWTDKEYMGLMPSAARQGSEIWLIRGCRMPLLLRRIHLGNHFELIGDCYVHGIMYGEAFQQDRCEDVVLI
jgi:hypothetical protein